MDKEKPKKKGEILYFIPVLKRKRKEEQKRLFRALREMNN